MRDAARRTMTKNTAHPDSTVVSYDTLYASDTHRSLRKTFRSLLAPYARRYDYSLSEAESILHQALNPALGNGNRPRTAHARALPIKSLARYCGRILRNARCREYEEKKHLAELTPGIEARLAAADHRDNGDDNRHADRVRRIREACGDPRPNVKRIARVIAQACDEGRNPSQQEIAAKLGIDQTTVSRNYKLIAKSYAPARDR